MTSARSRGGRPAVFVQQLHRAAAQRGKLDPAYQELSDHWTAILQRLYPVWALIGPGLSDPGHIEIHSRTIYLDSQTLLGTREQIAAGRLEQRAILRCFGVALHETLHAKHTKRWAIEHDIALSESDDPACRQLAIDRRLLEEPRMEAHGVREHPAGAIRGRFVRRALEDHGLSTHVVSIDPHPRAEVDALCDEVIRQPLEDVDPEVVDRQEPGDVFFLDGSHRVFMNSDVVAAFLDFLPRLKAGVHVHVHDIWIPSDYPREWSSRFYSEQYILAAQLLAGTTAYEVEFPAWFVTNDQELSLILQPLWDIPHMRRVERHGCSFWLVTR